MTSETNEPTRLVLECCEYCDCSVQHKKEAEEIARLKADLEQVNTQFQELRDGGIIAIEQIDKLKAELSQALSLLGTERDRFGKLECEMKAKHLGDRNEMQEEINIRDEQLYLMRLNDAEQRDLIKRLVESLEMMYRPGMYDIGQDPQTIRDEALSAAKEHLNKAGDTQISLCKAEGEEKT